MHSEHHVYVDRAGLSVGSRRRLLAGLASFGAFLPTSLAVGKNRDKRGRRRRQRRRNQTAAAGMLNVALSVHNSLATPVSVRKWGWSDKRSNQRGFWKEDDWQEIPARPAARPNPFLAVTKQDSVIVAELRTGHVVFAANPILGYPHITIWSGKWSRDGIDRNAAPKELLNTGLDVNEKQTVAGSKVLRFADSSSNKWIRITLV